MERKEIRYRIRRTAAFITAFAVAFPSCLATAQAGTVPVTTDETAYILLNYDGSVDDVSIVKACDLNGNSQITDYGYYSSVKNMSTEDEPQLWDDGVTWNITDTGERKFYYEVKPKEEFLDVPWNAEVSYKLNGVPAAPEELAGASGLIAVDVHVTPNEAADDYYKNNFMLLAGMVSDTEEDLSFAADGAQFQTLGSYQAAVYMAFPQTEETFHFEIGTESFENTGVFFAMMPVTMSQMDDIAEIREHKENLENAGDAMDDIMDDMLEIMGDMAEDTEKTADGLEQLDKAREEAHSYREAGDASLEDIKASVSRLEATITDFAAITGDSKLPAAVQEMGRGLEDISSTVNSLTGKMETMVDAMEKIEKTLEKINSMGDLEDKAQMMEKLKQEVEALQQQMGALEESGEIGELAAGIQSWLDSLEDAGYVPEGTIPELATPSEVDMPILDLDEMEAYGELLEEMAGSMVYEAKRMTSAIAKMADKGDDLVDGIDTIVDGVFDSADELDSILVITSDTMVDAAGLLGSLRSALDVADSMLDACDRDLNEGAHRTLEGLTGTLRQLTKSLNKSQDLKANKDIIADIVRDEWSRLDEDFNLLDIDTKAEKVSFTSLRNEEPRSLQIIMRTKEISIDEDAVEAAAQAEEGAAPDTVLGRIAAVFTAIWNFILGLFQ